MYIYQKIRKVLKKYFSKDDSVTYKEIVSITKKEYPKVKKDSILPSDLCDNHKNKSPFSGRHKIFHRLERGKYKII